MLRNNSTGVTGVMPSASFRGGVVALLGVTAVMLCGIRSSGDAAETKKQPIAAETTEATNKPEAMALLQGVEASRTKCDSLRATLEIRHLLPKPATTVDCLVEMVGDRRRFEIFSGEVPGQVILRDGDVFHGFRRVKNGDVDIYDVGAATGERGDVAFDPRVLGLSGLMPCDVNVKTCLGYEDNDGLQLIGQESLRGVNVWRIKVARYGNTAEFWIEEPSFRVHRHTVETKGGTHIEIDSYFESDATPSPFPSRVVTMRRSGQSEHERVYLMKTFDLVADIPKDRFTLRSMDLPTNTKINDYRLNQIVGYWDGEEVSPNLVNAADVLRPVRTIEKVWKKYILTQEGAVYTVDDMTQYAKKTKDGEKKAKLDDLKPGTIIEVQMEVGAGIVTKIVIRKE